MEEVLLSPLGLRTKSFARAGGIVAVGSVASSWAVYVAFNQPLAAAGFLVAVLVISAVIIIALVNKMMPTKQKPGGQVTF